MESSKLSPNMLAFIGLCNEFCQATEQAAETEQADFVRNMLRLLPRIYISATDLPDAEESSDGYIEPTMDESYYDSLRRGMETVMGEYDTYLEVFEEDMKYSDTPIAASISEGLADITQVCYNFIETLKHADAETIEDILHAMKEDFTAYWSQKLCNVVRALNNVRYSNTDNEY